MKSCLDRIRPSAADLLLSPPAVGIAADGVTVQWYGQSATRRTAPDGCAVVVAPFIRDKPVPPSVTAIQVGWATLI